MVNVVVLQGAAVPAFSDYFYLQITGGGFAETREAKIVMSGAVAEYVAKTMQSGLLCIVKGAYVPSGNYIQAESVAFLQDKLELGDQMWE
jgi:hypothetical protein